MFFIVEHHHTTYTTGCDDMARVETGSTQISTRGLCDGISGIFEKYDPRKSLSDSFPIGHVSYEIWQQEALCIRCDNFFQVIDGWYVRGETNITEYWFESQLHQWCHRCGKSTRGCHHFRSRGEVEGSETGEE